MTTLQQLVDLQKSDSTLSQLQDAVASHIKENPDKYPPETICEVLPIGFGPENEALRAEGFRWAVRVFGQRTTLLDTYLQVRTAQPQPTKVSFTAVEAMLSTVTYTYVRPEGTNNVICVAKLPDGYTMGVGQGSYIYGPNFDEEMGKQTALQNARNAAVDHAWLYQGIVLRERLIAAGKINAAS